MKNSLKKMEFLLAPAAAAAVQEGKEKHASFFRAPMGP